MRDIEHVFSGSQNELQQWLKILGGHIEGNILTTDEGTIEEYRFDNHLLLVVRLALKEQITVRRIMEKPMRYFPIIFSQSLIFEQQEDGTTLAIPSKSLSTGIYFSSENVQIQYPAGGEFGIVLFRPSMEAMERILPLEHPFMTQLRIGDPYYFYESITVEMKRLMQDLLAAPSYPKIAQELAYARSWELFTLFAERFFYQRQNQYRQIAKYELQKLQQVKELILSDLSAHKSIEELTGFCGMSATKLRTLFKELYGMSIYSLFQEHRMERARELLLEGNKSVSEVAYTLGYTHLGHFTGAFKQKFNYLPKELKL